MTAVPARAGGWCRARCARAVAAVAALAVLAVLSVPASDWSSPSGRPCCDARDETLDQRADDLASPGARGPEPGRPRPGVRGRRRPGGRPSTAASCAASPRLDGDLPRTHADHRPTTVELPDGRRACWSPGTDRRHATSWSPARLDDVRTSTAALCAVAAPRRAAEHRRPRRRASGGWSAGRSGRSRRCAREVEQIIGGATWTGACRSRPTPDEIARLARTMNAMLDRLAGVRRAAAPVRGRRLARAAQPAAPGCAPSSRSTVRTPSPPTRPPRRASVLERDGRAAAAGRRPAAAGARATRGRWTTCGPVRSTSTTSCSTRWSRRRRGAAPDRHRGVTPVQRAAATRRSSAGPSGNLLDNAVRHARPVTVTLGEQRRDAPS